jgi:pyruvate dehydrogenase E2 component (dihydrolipoamide acetyltransferase)
MDLVIKTREELNLNEKEFGVKISINDFIMKACALASRDYPDVNVQWSDKAIKKFRYVDLAMAVATDKGLITPIIFRADTKGLLEIAKASKDLAKRAR